MKSHEVNSDVQRVRQIAAIPENERLRHFCDLAHERLIKTSDLPILQKLCASTVIIEEGADYPQCQQIEGRPSSIGCAHRPDDWYAIQNTLVRLQQQVTDSTNVLTEVMQMKRAVDDSFARLYGRDGIDIQMADACLKEIISPEDEIQKRALATEHREIVAMLFRYSERIVELIDCDVQ